MDGSDAPAPARDGHGRFMPGHAGRAFGSRNRQSKRVARAILADFEAHKAELLPKLRRWFLPQYMQVVSRLLPKTSETGGVELDALDDAEMAQLLADARAAFARIEAGQGTLADLEAALLGEGGHNSATTLMGDLG